MQCECDFYSRHWFAGLQAWGADCIERARFHFLQLSSLIMPKPDVAEHPECIFHTMLNLLLVSQRKKLSKDQLLAYSVTMASIPLSRVSARFYSAYIILDGVFVCLVFIYLVFLPNNWWQWGTLEYSCVFLVSWVVRTNAYALASCDFCMHIELCLQARVMGIGFVQRMLSKNLLSIPNEAH